MARRCMAGPPKRGNPVTFLDAIARFQAGTETPKQNTFAFGDRIGYPVFRETNNLCTWFMFRFT